MSRRVVCKALGSSFDCQREWQQIVEGSIFRRHTSIDKSAQEHCVSRAIATVWKVPTFTVHEASDLVGDPIRGSFASSR